MIMRYFPAQILPKQFDLVQLGGIRRQWNDHQAVSILLQAGQCLFATMNDVIVHHQANLRAMIFLTGAVLSHNLLDQSAETVAVLTLIHPAGLKLHPDNKTEALMGKVTLDMSISLDGFIAGTNDGVERPLGDGGERLHEWL